jgi:hypothetical protein
MRGPESVGARPKRFELSGEGGAFVGWLLQSTDDDGWLAGHAEVRSGTFRGSAVVEGPEEAFAAFRRELEELDSKLTGRVELSLDRGLRVLVVGEHGRLGVSGSLVEYGPDGGNKLDFTFDSDQTYLRRSLSAGDSD